METKKSKVTTIEKRDQKDGYGNTSFVVSFENGDKGWYTSKNEDQTKFVAGKQAEYIIEEKQGAKAKYFKITIPQKENNFGSGGFQKKSADPKVQIISFAASYTKDLICAGKATPESFEFTFDKIYNKMISKL
jgi:hypothetical protein